MGGFRRFTPPNEETSVLRPACMNFNPDAPYTASNIDEDWTNITCVKQRRRMQNRNAQRKYRIRMRKRLEHLQRLEDSVSACMAAIDLKPTLTANACSGEQPISGEPSLSSVPGESGFMGSARGCLPTTTSPPNPETAVYITDDNGRHNMYIDTDVRGSADLHSTNFSLFEDIKPSIVYDNRENFLVNDMAICPLAMSYISLANLWMPQQPQLGAMK